MCNTHEVTLVVETTDFQEVADTRPSLRNHNSEILSLGVQLERIRAGGHDLHKQYRRTSQDYANTVCRDDEENLNRFKKREEKVKSLLEQKH